MKDARILCFLILTLLVSMNVEAQTGLGELMGFVFDETEAVVPDVEIVLNGPALMGSRTIHTSSRGMYRFINLQPGKYEITISKENYRSQVIRDLVVRAGKTSSFNVTMEIGKFTETLTIIHDSPIIDLKNSERGLNIDGDFISRMPLSPSREWEQIWNLVPGVDFQGTYIHNNNNKRDLLYVHGQDYKQNMYNLDGMNIGNPWQNRNTVTFSTEIIEDIQVVTGGYSAATRPGTGGYVNVITKSGGNEFSGSAVLTFQPESWNWSNVPGGDAAEQESYIPEASFGGPIMRDKIWFFMGYRYDHITNGVSRTAEQLAQYDVLELPRPTSKLKQFGHRFFGKVTTDLTSRDKVVFTYNWDRVKREGSGFWAYADSRATRSVDGGPRYALDYNRLWSDNLNTSFKVSYQMYDFGSDKGIDHKGEILRVAKLTQYSWGLYPDFNFPHIYHNGIGTAFSRDGSQMEARGDATWYVQDLFGNHEFGFGFSGRPTSRSEEIYTYPDGFESAIEAKNAEGEWVFFSELNYINRERFVAVYGSKTFGGYIEDAWVVNDRLAFNLGLRLQRDYDNQGGLYKSGSLGGSFGFTYALTSDQKQSVRFNISRKQEEINGRPRSSISSGDPGVIIRYDDDLDGVWDRELSRDPRDPTVRTYKDNFYPVEVDPDYGPSLLDSFSLGYVIALPLGVQFDASYIYKISHNQATSTWDANYIWENGQVVGLKDPENARTVLYFNDKWSSIHYQALELTATKEFRQGWQLITSYSYQDQTLKGEWNPYSPYRHFYPESWFEVSRYGGLQPHTFSLAASFILPRDFILNASVNARAGYFEDPREHPRDYSVPRDITLSNGTVIRNPFYGIANYAQPRNSDARTQINGVSNVNVGLGRQFSYGPYRISTQFQVFNIFNDGNFTQFYGTDYDENMQPLNQFRLIDVQSPRAAQLLVKFTF